MKMTKIKSMVRLLVLAALGFQSVMASGATLNYWINFDDNGGSGGPGYHAAGAANLDMPLPTSVGCPTRTGYDFTGYYVDGTRIYQSDGGLTSGYSAFRALCAAYNPCRLYAGWQVKSYTVTLDWQGGTGGSYSSRTVTYDSAMPGLGTLPKKTGWKFAGYFDATGKRYYNSDGTSAANWDKAANTTLTARWVDDLNWATLSGSAPDAFTLDSELITNYR